VITSFIITGLLSAISIIFGPLPSGSSLNLTTQAATITTSSYWPQLGWLNNYIPVDQAVAALTLIITTWGVVYLIRIGIWLWNLLPIGGSN
jgi:hypothetical protein